jgi:type II secretory pathway pseudopilin PulG
MTTETVQASMPTAAPSGDRGERGYSLIEVLAASALLLGVLLAIMGMFVYGGKSVNAGKMMTKATSIADDVLEEFRDLSFAQHYLVIEDGGNINVDKSYTWNSKTNTPNYPDDSGYQAILASWKNQVETQLPKGSGEVTVTVRGLRDLGTSTTDPVEETFANARILQVVVTVRWKEAKRVRSVVFETFKS